VAEDVRIKVTLDTEEAERDLRGLKNEAKGAAQEIDKATGGDGSATGTRGRVPAGRSAAARFGAGGTSGLGGALGGLGRLAGPAALGAANQIFQGGVSELRRPGAGASDFGGGALRAAGDLARSIPGIGGIAGAAFDRTIGTALDVREQAIQATAQATSGLAAAGIQVDQETLAQINAIQMEQGLRQVRNEAAARRAGPGIFDSILALGLE
jgi:hypothetical protein